LPKDPYSFSTWKAIMGPPLKIPLLKRKEEKTRTEKKKESEKNKKIRIPREYCKGASMGKSTLRNLSTAWR